MPKGVDGSGVLGKKAPGSKGVSGVATGVGGANKTPTGIHKGDSGWPGVMDSRPGPSDNTQSAKK
jgi:hypothetical protein